MTRRSLVLALFVGCCFSLSQGTAQVAQDPTVRERSKQARELIKALSVYPQPVREAVVIVSQNPKLAGQLFDAVKDDMPAELTAVLKDHPKEVQDAGRLLAKYPEVLDTMLVYKALLTWAGEVYAKAGPEAVKKIAEEIKSEDEVTARSVELWAGRLSSNRVALHQLLEAISAFHEEQPTKEYADYGMGVSVDSKNVASVYALPPAPLASFILIHADHYTEIADELVEQWLHTNSNSDFDQLLSHLWLANRAQFPDSILDPKGRPERIKELSNLAKSYGGSLKEGEMPSLEGRSKYLKEHAADFPLLSALPAIDASKLPQLKEGDPVPKPRVPYKSRGQVAANKPLPPAPPRPVIDKKAALAAPAPSSSAVAQRDVPSEVKQVKPTEEQQVRRGAYAQYYFYNIQNIQAPAAYPTPSPYFYGWNPYMNPAGGRVVTPAQYANGRTWNNRPNFNRPVGGRGGRR